MSRFSTQELFLTGITVVVVGFTVAIGSSSLTSLVGVSEGAKSDGQSQDNAAAQRPASGDSEGSGSKDTGGSQGGQNASSGKTDGDNRSVSSDGGSTGGSGENKNAVMPEKTDGNNQPVYSSEEEGRRFEEQRQQELIEQAKRGYEETLREYWDSVLKEQQRDAERIQELSRGDMNKDGMMDTTDRASYEKMMESQQKYIDAMRKQMHAAPEQKQDINQDVRVDQSDLQNVQNLQEEMRDINSDGIVDQVDVQRIQKVMELMRDRVMEEQKKMAPNDIDGDGVVTPEEEYGYMRKEEIPDVDVQEETAESDMGIWAKLKETFYRGDEGEEKVDHTVKYAPDGSVERITTYEYFEDTSPSVKDGAAKQESIWSKLNPLNWFGRKSDQVSTDGIEGRPVHSGASEDSGTPKGLPFEGKPVPGKPFNEEGVSEGRPFDAIWTEEEPTEFGGATTGGMGDTEPEPDIIRPTPYENFLNDRNDMDDVDWSGENWPNGVNGINGLNGMNGLNGINGVNGLNGMNGINGVNGMNGLNGIDGLNGLPKPRPSRVFLDTDQKPELSVSDKKESGFWDTVKGLFGF